ncbi:putative type IX sorting system protein PorV2 [Tenacibaculum agarivorans]|uniref:putative type IX sorting system protein PorV2 n=1 Tax=Tenacibaculum agarivorans TaxID=1908389 RepID=UPI00094BC0C6|nr:PorV/PorQ family protein [Tenacibaculum agarivorans]
MKTKFFYLFLFFTVFVQAQFRNFSNEFLNIGVDAAALGMSKSVVATSNDVNASYWNPAGLVAVKDYQGTLMHASYFAGIATYNYGGFAMPIDDDSAVGLSIIRFGVDDILNTTELIDGDGNIDFNRINLFSAADYAFTVSYARKLPAEGLSIGGNAKIIRRIIGDFATSWGFGFDLGIQYQKNGWRFGAMARDITTTFNTWAINETEFEKIRKAVPGQNQELPETTEITKPKLQLGVARSFKLGSNFNLLSEIDLNMRFAETNDIISSSFVSIDPAFGFQLDYKQFVFLRLGAGNFQNTIEFNGDNSLSVQPNFGLGFTFKGIQIDYALTNIGSVGNALFSNIFSIKFDYSFYR